MPQEFVGIPIFGTAGLRSLTTRRRTRSTYLFRAFAILIASIVRHAAARQLGHPVHTILGIRRKIGRFEFARPRLIDEIAARILNSDVAFFETDSQTFGNARTFVNEIRYVREPVGFGCGHDRIRSAFDIRISLQGRLAIGNIRIVQSQPNDEIRSFRSISRTRSENFPGFGGYSFFEVGVRSLRIQLELKRKSEIVVIANTNNVTVFIHSPETESILRTNPRLVAISFRYFLAATLPIRRMYGRGT